MEKAFFTLIFLVISFVSSSQTKVKSGYITFLSNSTIYFKDLTLTDDTVTFYNEAKSEEKFSLKSVKKIVDNTGAIVYQLSQQKAITQATLEIDSDSVNIVKKEIFQELKYKSSSKIYLNDELLSSEQIENIMQKNTYALEHYKKGKRNVVLGNILIGGGLGFVIGGGVSNLMASNSDNGGGSPAFIIVGLATTAVGIPVRIHASRKIKNSVETYNSSAQKTSFLEKAEINILTNPNGLGFTLHF